MLIQLHERGKREGQVRIAKNRKSCICQENPGISNKIRIFELTTFMKFNLRLLFLHELTKQL